MSDTGLARGLAWFGIGLGVAEMLAPRRVARLTGLQGHEALLQAFGAREVASGIVILAAEDPAALVWVRTLGDLLDAMLLTAGMRAVNPRRGRVVLAAAAVAPVVALDALVALRASRLAAAE